MAPERQNGDNYAGNFNYPDDGLRIVPILPGISSCLGRAIAGGSWGNCGAAVGRLRILVFGLCVDANSRGLGAGYLGAKADQCRYFGAWGWGGRHGVRCCDSALAHFTRNDLDRDRLFAGSYGLLLCGGAQLFSRRFRHDGRLHSRDRIAGQYRRGFPFDPFGRAVWLAAFNYDD